jgi:hypothetical protein
MDVEPAGADRAAARPRADPEGEPLEDVQQALEEPSRQAGRDTAQHHGGDQAAPRATSRGRCPD